MPLDAELAGRREEQWRRESGLVDEERFALRLEQQGLDAERFRTLLGSPAPPVAVLEHADPQHGAPEIGDGAAWWRWIEQAYADSAESFDRPAGAEPLAELVDSRSDGVFLDVVRPLLGLARGRWYEQLASEGTGELFSVETFAGQWFRPLPGQLLAMVSRTLVLELYIRRLQGDLEGDTPEARFRHFLDGYGGEGAFELWQQYPVLARSLATRVEQWLEAGSELASRLRRDGPMLVDRFAIEGPLEAIEGGLGDRHENGRTVVALRFRGGRRVVYKPRSLAIEKTFQALLAWLGDQGVRPRLRTLEVLDRGTHGWVEFVEQAPCADAGQVERFYARQGIYLALLYVLEATDFHHENLIAAGEHPVLIDLETLFQPLLLDRQRAREDLNPVATTVLRSGLLPRESWAEGGIEEADLSGLGAPATLVTPSRRLVAVGTDEMAFADQSAEVAMGRHLPTLAGEAVSLFTHSGTILDAFERTYRELERLRPHFVDPGGWLERFAGQETRIIVRPTGLYVRLLHLLFHPDYLADALQRERLLDKLWLDAERYSYIPAVVPAERSALWRSDVPRFVASTDSRDLRAHGVAELVGAFDESGLELVRQRFADLCDDDLERQRSLARLALAAVRPPGAGPDASAAAHDLAAPDPATPEPATASGLGASNGGPFSEPTADEATTTRSELERRAFRHAHRIGDRLRRLAFRSEGWASWFDLHPGGGRQKLQPVGPDLYSGLGGIALFFARLARAEGELDAPDPDFDSLARSALATARQRIERQPGFRQGLGGFSGLGGWIYTLAYLGALWHEPALLDEAEAEAERVPGRVDDDQGLDLIAGSAGCIAGLLALYRLRPADRLLAVATRCGDHLLARSQPMPAGRAWHLPAVADLPLTGFAHGAAGMAWALAKLAAVTGEARFDEAARAGLDYERSLFDPRHDNWPDLRFDRRRDGRWAHFHAWCHGAPGIGLARLDLLRHWNGDALDRAAREAEIEAAVRSTRAAGFGDNHCLCHGDLGNLELLTRAERVLGPVAAGEVDAGGGRAGGGSAEAVAKTVLDGMGTGHYRCGIDSRVELPGLMTGLAGIGYGLLRLADPAIPSVLLFEIP